VQISQSTFVSNEKQSPTFYNYARRHRHTVVGAKQGNCISTSAYDSHANFRIPRSRRAVLVSAQSAGSPEDVLNSSDAPFNAEFLGVLQQSLAREGPDALLKGVKAEERISAVEEVLTTALNQSKQSYRMLSQWRLQVDAQLVAQEKQITRMEFALNKARNDAAMMKSLKKMVYENDSD